MLWRKNYSLQFFMSWNFRWTLEFVASFDGLPITTNSRKWFSFPLTKFSNLFWTICLDVERGNWNQQLRAARVKQFYLHTSTWDHLQVDWVSVLSFQANAISPLLLITQFYIMLYLWLLFNYDWLWLHTNGLCHSLVFNSLQTTREWLWYCKCKHTNKWGWNWRCFRGRKGHWGWSWSRKWLVEAIHASLNLVRIKLKLILWCIILSFLFSFFNK